MKCSQKLNKVEYAFFRITRLKYKTILRINIFRKDREKTKGKNTSLYDNKNMIVKMVKQNKNIFFNRFKNINRI